VLDGRGAIAASSTYIQNGSQDPVEAVSFSYDPSRAPYTAEVVWVSGPTSGLDVTLFSFDNTFSPAIAASSTMDPADAHGALAVGAIPQSSYSETIPPLEPYSSQGPTTDGRTKPDFCAPDGTSTYTYGILGSYGTSFSAPVAAGAVALRQQKLGFFYPADLVGTLSGLTAPIGTPTPNSLCGNGKIIAWKPGACGVGGELVLVFPALLWLRRKRRAARADRATKGSHQKQESPAAPRQATG
jgi:subtilase family protein